MIATVSLGVAVSTDGREIIYEMLNQADVALYEAKRQGRDRLVLASGHPGALAAPADIAGVEAASAI
jgi:predicted signal transduction protein with EAL and GGDEF domain